MSEHDDAQAAAAALRKAVEELGGDGDGGDGQAAQEAVRVLSGGAGQEWTPEQEGQIRALVEQIRRVRKLNRPDAGWWHRKREWRARERLVDLMMAGGPELVSEAELRLWKNHAMVEVLLEFANSAMKQDDIAKTLARMETLHTATYEGWQQARKALADEQAATG
uniref:hypothetical protein n=1 Tax=Streptomyces sp. NBC_01001 TaxID=2903713 RepID=UPI002F91BA91|nr:hypothetical protein OG296_43030 [Streptomyces sp. NBC_01001]